jgi:hypothetical protein
LSLKKTIIRNKKPQIPIENTSRRNYLSQTKKTLAGLLLVLLPVSAAWAGLTASVTRVASATDIYPGETANLQITLSNNSTSASITGVDFSNSLPGTLPNGLLEVLAPLALTINHPA